jgi:cytochrome c peroxidase
LRSDFDWKLPYNFPPSAVPADNPMSVAKVELGHLFYDKRMSLNGRQSCGAASGRSWRLRTAHAVGRGELHPRSSMSLANVAYTPLMTWANPEVRSLEEQVVIPMFGETRSSSA